MNKIDAFDLWLGNKIETAKQSIKQDYRMAKAEVEKEKDNKCCAFPLWASILLWVVIINE